MKLMLMLIAQSSRPRALAVSSLLRVLPYVMMPSTTVPPSST
jgi:hypothetical protein